jgi:hypothetical protein
MGQSGDQPAGQKPQAQAQKGENHQGAEQAFPDDSLDFGVVELAKGLAESLKHANLRRIWLHYRPWRRPCKQRVASS